MPYITHSNISLHTQAVGNGPAVVCCHGLIQGNIASWYFSLAHVLSSHQKLIMYDLRGHGKSSVTKDGYSLDVMCDDLQAVIDAERGGKDKPLHLVGHSFGGLVVLHYALRKTANISSLTLIDAPIPASKMILPSLLPLKKQAQRVQFVDECFKQLGITSNRQRLQLLKRLDFLITESTLLDELSLMGEVSNSDFQELTMPVLCLFGKQSPCFEKGKAIAKMIPQSTFQEIDCGHYIPLEAPQEMAIRVNEFLTSLNQGESYHEENKAISS